MRLSDDLLELLRLPSFCYLATSMADGSRQVTQTWVDTDGEQGYVKLRNIERDPRAALAISHPDDPRSYVQVGAGP